MLPVSEAEAEGGEEDRKPVPPPERLAGSVWGDGEGSALIEEVECRGATAGRPAAGLSWVGCYGVGPNGGEPC